MTPTRLPVKESLNELQCGTKWTATNSSALVKPSEAAAGRPPVSWHRQHEYDERQQQLDLTGRSHLHGDGVNAAAEVVGAVGEDGDQVEGGGPAEQAQRGPVGLRPAGRPAHCGSDHCDLLGCDAAFTDCPSGNRTIVGDRLSVSLGMIAAACRQAVAHAHR